MGLVPSVSNWPQAAVTIAVLIVGGMLVSKLVDVLARALKR